MFNAGNVQPASAGSWEPCTPVVPDDRGLEYYGGPVGSFYVNGTWRVRNDKGQITYETSGDFHWLTCGCFDPDNPDYISSGMGNDGLCYCKGNRQRDALGNCVAPPDIFSVTLDGPSSISAMPASNATLVATVKRNGAPLASMGVHIDLNGKRIFTGVTGPAGQFLFSYMPSTFQTTDIVTASCDGCIAPATQTITVDPADVMCTPESN